MAEPVGRLDPAAWLGRRVTVTVDRPMGSSHPEHGFTYPINYGYVAGFIAPDGEELDAYVLGPDGPVAELTGQVIAVITREDDVEDKLVVGDSSWSRADIERATHFQEQFFRSTVHCERPRHT